MTATPGPTVSISLAGVARAVRNLGAIGALVTGAANLGGLPTSVRAVLVAVGGLHQIADHYVITGLRPLVDALARILSSPPAPPPPARSSTA